jgi:hypothetical protein
MYRIGHCYLARASAAIDFGQRIFVKLIAAVRLTHTTAFRFYNYSGGRLVETDNATEVNQPRISVLLLPPARAQHMGYNSLTSCSAGHSCKNHWEKLPVPQFFQFFY